MRERLNRAVSKTVEPLLVPGVRIPLSPLVSLFLFLSFFAFFFGEMTERSKVRDWKSRVSVRVPRVQIPVSPPTRFEGRKPGTVLVTAAQPRQVRKEATVSGRCGAAERLAFCPRGFTLTPLRVILNPCLMKSPRHENVLKYLSNSLVRSLSPPRLKNR